MKRIVVVGASLAGLSAAKALRRLGFDGRIAIVGDERHMPYQRPPLSKQFLRGTWQRELHLLVEQHDFDWHLGAAARGLDLARREVEIGDDIRLPFDGLVVATGARPKKLPGGAPDGVFTLRNIGDAIAIRERVERGARNVAIIGAGFIGCEVAASLVTLGCAVTLIDMDSYPMQRVLGRELGAVCLDIHRANGVRAMFDVAFAGYIGSPSVEGVQLADGRVVNADLVVVGVGATPNVEWLSDSGIPVNDGVLCDASCAVQGMEGIVAAGDVARWEHPRYGSIRVEHWDNAIAQGEAAARRLLEGPEHAQPFGLTPFFWSDQYDRKLQLVGVPRASDTIRMVEGTPESGRFVALFERDGDVTAAFLCNSMHRLARYKDLVEIDRALEVQST